MYVTAFFQDSGEEAAKLDQLTTCMKNAAPVPLVFSGTWHLKRTHFFELIWLQARELLSPVSAADLAHCTTELLGINLALLQHVLSTREPALGAGHKGFREHEGLFPFQVFDSEPG